MMGTLDSTSAWYSFTMPVLTCMQMLLSSVNTPRQPTYCRQLKLLHYQSSA